ncbi:hypothetical protein APHAL10511_001559 [Amanita phalloides]|nr:hypothetical protein APHAL10511_001559 [Amanita phalloides]
MSKIQSGYWLLKAEPESRVVKGKDVKFSVDDFEAVETSPWEGVRNYEARNLMKEMKVGDKVLFYQSNCRNPGVVAFAEVSKEAYADHSAWDPAHPYYDLKSDKNNPRWFMVDVTFESRAKHFVPLALLKHIAASPSDRIPQDISYIGPEGCKAIREMDLVTRGRLSVQRVSEEAWHAIELLADRGGWDETFWTKRSAKDGTTRKKAAKGKVPEEPASAADGGQGSKPESLINPKRNQKRKRKASQDVENEPRQKTSRS